MNTDRVSSLFWLAVALVTIYGSVHLGLGNLHEPGSGFLSFLAGVFISLMSIGIFLQSFIRWRGVPLNLRVLWTGVNWHRSLIICLLVFGFIVVLERLGFILTSLLLLFLLFKWVENFSWTKAVIIPGLTFGLTYLLFEVFLKATLPKGIFGF